MAIANRWGGISATLAIALGAALLGFAGGWAWQATGAGRGATETVVREYILDHPEILPQAMQRMQQRELAARLAPLRGALENPYPGAVLGNPRGTVTLVEFSDYACPYCKAAEPRLMALVKRDKGVRLVLKEFPILTKPSIVASRMALAARKQGKYEPFHLAMMRHQGQLLVSDIEELAKASGLDVARLKRDMNAPDVTDEIILV